MAEEALNSLSKIEKAIFDLEEKHLRLIETDETVQPVDFDSIKAQIKLCEKSFKRVYNKKKAVKPKEN